ncbi:uncharacterized protein N7473_011966 [Penicillium subrubescens]|nr:uncharacterized protein N7473_011966 [Penicillium subrubescens]KAJ5880913.1 hypothetical protein N7473_011966 [Penicillium subrubescens]
MDGIRTELQVYAYLDPENPAHIIVSNNEGFDSVSVVKFLRAAWVEGMGRTDLHIKKLMLAPLPVESSMYAVTLLRHNLVAKPYLHQVERQDAYTGRQVFAHKMNAMHTANFKEILQDMRTSLSMVNYFNGNLRMRFHFGTLILDRFMSPKTNETAVNLFDFADMIGHDQCRGRVVPGQKISMETLLNRFRDADDLLEPIGQTRPLSELELMEPTHSATIEFLGSPGSDFRLELYLKRIARAGEVEIKGHRWFKARHGEDKTLRMPLQLAMVDFGRADWQCDIEFFEVAAERLLSKSQRELASSIRFTSNGDNHHFVSHAAMNIWIPRDTPDAHIVKKSAIRFKVKRTNLVLELARFDIYRRTKFIKSYASASLYDPNWDSLLGGEIGVGGAQIQPHGAGLEAFFPSSLDSNAVEGAGLIEVLYVVQKIAELLGGSAIGLNQPPKDENVAAWMDVELGTLF